MFAEYVPGPHEMQLKGDVAPVASEYFPAAQSVQVAKDTAPTAVEYVPALHVEHWLAWASEYDPGSQRRHDAEKAAIIADE